MAEQVVAALELGAWRRLPREMVDPLHLRVARSCVDSKQQSSA